MRARVLKALVLQRSLRPMTDADRLILARYRERDIGQVGFEAKTTFLAGFAGLVAGFLWFGFVHAGDRNAPFWPIIVAAALGAALGLPKDLLRTRRLLIKRRSAAAAKWDPVVEVGSIEQVVAHAAQGVRLDDDQANTAWFLQVVDEQILCVWDWADEATEHVQVDLVPGASPTVLKISWTGAKLYCPRPKRKFKRGEHEPEQCEILSGNLDQLDALLASLGRPKRKPARSRKPTTATRGSKLADELEPLGFYKFACPDQVEEIKAEVELSRDAHTWFQAVGRAFGADGERLATGGVKDLLDYMRPALRFEGCALGEIDQSYEPETSGYTLTIGGESNALWNRSEAKSSWELTITRTADLLDRWLSEAGSAERIHLLSGGHDGVMVLLTPSMRSLMAQSGLFRKADLPVPL